MSAISSPDWREPGKKLQDAIAAIQAESPRRDIRGRFVHQYSAAEITLRALRAYAPPQVEPRISEVPLDAVEGESRRLECTGARRESGETNLRETGDSIQFLVPETAAETGPHPLPIIPKFPAIRIINATFAVTLLAIAMGGVNPILVTLAVLYGIANAVVAWEGR